MAWHEVPQTAHACHAMYLIQATHHVWTAAAAAPDDVVTDNLSGVAQGNNVS